MPCSTRIICKMTQQICYHSNYWIANWNSFNNNFRFSQTSGYSQVIWFRVLCNSAIKWVFFSKSPGPSCSKLTTPLIDETLKFLAYYMRKHICRKNLRNLQFFCKNIATVDFVNTVRLNKSSANEFLKLTMLGPGPGCSKLTTSLVNVSLKFQMLIS